jgi:hypothetical protein
MRMPTVMPARKPTYIWYPLTNEKRIKIAPKM